MVQGVEHGAAPGRYASWGIVDLAAVTLPLPLDPQIAVAAARGGEIGIVDLEWIDDPHAARAPIRRLVREGGDRVGLKLRASSRGLVDLLEDLAPRLDVVVLVRGNAEENEAALDRLRRVARRVLLEARSAEEAAIGEELGFDGLVAKGSEGGGWIGNETSLVLLQRLVARGRLPVWAHGGVGLHSIAACFAAGAAGAIVDAPLALSRESPLGDDVRAALARADGSEAVCLGEALARPFRVFGRAGDATVRDLRALAEALERSPAPVAERRGQWEIEVRRRIGSRHYAILPLGQDIAFAASLAGRYPTVAGILYALRTWLGAHVRIAKRLEPLAEGSPLARAHGTRFPIVQGPMTRVSDTPEFAARIAEAGALPFVALALKRGSELGELLQGTIAALGSKPWGAGILGFVPADVRAEQLAAVAVHRRARAHRCIARIVPRARGQKIRLRGPGVRGSCWAALEHGVVGPRGGRAPGVVDPREPRDGGRLPCPLRRRNSRRAFGGDGGRVGFAACGARRARRGPRRHGVPVHARGRRVGCDRPWLSRRSNSVREHGAPRVGGRPCDALRADAVRRGVSRPPR
ncbi:MAG: hypothetical protein E6J90_21255 [Deltaproteobacteria bacterium]|nr:MAG: hypothetical protein E6J90_21255 [Deltaproteobacteria bacterium]